MAHASLLVLVVMMCIHVGYESGCAGSSVNNIIVTNLMECITCILNETHCTLVFDDSCYNMITLLCLLLTGMLACPMTSSWHCVVLVLFLV